MESKTALEKLKLPLYSFAFGIGTAIGGERFVSYLKERYENHREKELEELVEKVVRKYKEMDKE